VVIEQPPIDSTPEREIESSTTSEPAVETEEKRPKECWQGDDWRERQVMDEHFARELRQKILGKKGNK